MPARSYNERLERAEALIADAGRLLREQRPMLVAAALSAESVPVPMWALDRAHGLLWGNRAFEARYGVSVLEQRGRTPAEWAGDGYGDMSRVDEEVMQTGNPAQYVADVDGRGIMVKKWPLQAEDGSVIGVCGVLS